MHPSSRTRVPLALLALAAVARRPEAAVYLGYRPMDPVVPSPADPPAEREFVGPDGGRVAVSRRGATFAVEERASESAIELTYWPAAALTQRTQPPSPHQYPVPQRKPLLYRCYRKSRGSSLLST